MHLCRIISWLILAEVGVEWPVQVRCRIDVSRSARLAWAGRQLAVGTPAADTGLAAGRAVIEGAGVPPANGRLAGRLLAGLKAGAGMTAR